MIEKEQCIVIGLEDGQLAYNRKIQKEYLEIIKKKKLIIFNEKASPQQVRVVGDNTRLTNEVKFTPKYTLNKALKEVIYDL